MKNSKIYIAVLVFIFGIFSCGGSKDNLIVGCMDRSATNFNSNANSNCSNCCTYKPKQGGVLFWSGDAALYGSCGLITIALNNGKQTTISGYYNLAPADCVNRVGGYILLDVGDYNYTVSFSNSGCSGGTGSISVSEGCNRIRLY